MKNVFLFLLLLGFLIVLAPTPSTQADNPERIATGSIKFTLGDGAPSYAEFAAQLHDDGSTTGEMTFSGPKEFLEHNVEGGSQEEKDLKERPAGASTQFYFKAVFDCMVVKGTQAVMSGTVIESNTKRYIGQRVLLVVQDKGDGLKSASADRLTWGLYDPKPRTWVASDAEVENDTGIGTTWLATDAERDDDPGIPSDKSEAIGCQTFPFSSFSLVKLKNGEGDIKVRP